MAHEDYGREPRWNTAGYWTDRQARERNPEDENREGDRSLSRNYDREDMRRYASRSVDQGQRMRQMRGETGRVRNDRPGQPRMNQPGAGRAQPRQGGPNPQQGQRQNNPNRQRFDPGPGWARPPRMGRQPGEAWSRGGSGYDYPGHVSDLGYESNLGYARNRGYSRNRNRFRDEDFDYDAERDYRGYHTGRDMNLEGSGEPGRGMRDPYPNRDFERDPNRARDRGRRYQWARARAINDSGRDAGRDRARDPGRDTYDNFWGERQQGRRYRVRDRGAWWNNAGGRGDVTSARGYGSGISTGPNFDWLDDRGYDFDPGYAYEFGTDFDFLNDVPASTQERRDWDQSRRRNQQRREQRQRDQQSHRPNQGTWAAFEYGWQGSPERPQARYREIWDIPGPFVGMGPQGYTRSDEAILDEICEIFTQNGRINASAIAIQVNNGQVTLAGDVGRKEEKYLAEDIASSISGVKDITNHLRVQTHEGARASGKERIQPGMRVAGVDGKNIGQVREMRQSGFILTREGGGEVFIPFRAVKRTNGQIILHVHGNEIDRQDWKE